MVVSYRGTPLGRRLRHP